MPLDSQKNKQSTTSEDTKVNGVEEQLLTPQQVMAGSSTVMTHKERQAYLKNSELGEKLNI